MIGTVTTATPQAEGGTPVAEVTTTYHPGTGLLATTSMGAASTSSLNDSFGRTVSYTDADANTSTTTYDIDGNLATFADGKGSTTYTYDGTDAAGKAERRGLATKLDVSGVGTFAGVYDADGTLASQSYPGGLSASWRRDSVGNQTGLTYAKGGAQWLDFTNTPGIGDGVAHISGPGGSQQNYTYDTAGRLTEVADTYAGQCTTRAYGFTPSSNRSSLATYNPASDGRCSAAGTPTTRTYSYDQADRLTNPGYAYDTFGRTTTVPAADTPRGVSLAVGYHINDLVASMTAGGVNRTFTLDPEERVRSTAQTGGADAGTTINHYGDTSDEPVWIAEASGGWSRNVAGLTGGLAAVHSSDGTAKLQLANLHGDLVATTAIADTGIDTYSEQTEYGINRTPAATMSRFGWLGTAQRATDPLGGLLIMGVRLYNPASGRFLQTDPVDGGSANDYDYCNADPINCRDLDGRLAWFAAVVFIPGIGQIAAAIAAAALIAAAAVLAYKLAQQAIAYAHRKKQETERVQKDRKEHTQGASRTTRDKHEAAATHGGRRDTCNVNTCRNPDHDHTKPKKKKKKKGK